MGQQEPLKVFLTPCSAEHEWVWRKRPQISSQKDLYVCNNGKVKSAFKACIDDLVAYNKTEDKYLKYFEIFFPACLQFN